MNLVTVATCSLDQWALDFEGNLARIRASIREAKARGARFRVGPELEIPGYGCEDHFLENDILRHGWETLAELLSDDLTDGILCDVGLPVLHRGVRYNARAFLLDRRILLIRPKMALADDGNYREGRWFAPWRRPRGTEPFVLPARLREATGQATVPIGDAVVTTADSAIASESCEELFTPRAPHLELGLDGVEIFANGSASHHELRKLERRLHRIRAATEGFGGVYLYANQRGCDGGRLYYDGGAMIVVNGEVVAQGSQFSPREVEVVTAEVDLDRVRSLRAAVPSRMRQAAETPPFPRVRADLTLARPDDGVPSVPRPLRSHPPEEEIALGPACWLWDYLRRSGATGFFLALSGGVDSAAVATIVGSMCVLLAHEVEAGQEGVVADLRRVLGLGPDEALPDDPRALAGRLLTTAYLPSRVSSSETRDRARALAEEVGARHLEVGVEGPVAAFAEAHAEAAASDAPRPRFRAHGGAPREDLALQNLQARSRMVLSYLLAQLDPAGARLVLATSNVDETLRGYVTKYDTSSADLNPIGGISKGDLRRFLAWARERLGYASLDAILAASPSAELAPADEAGPQSDEREIGLTYEELSRLGYLRKVERCGPLETFERLVHEWRPLAPREVAERVERFYRAYAIHRHKTTVLTPSYHAEAYGVEDHRYDLRPFLVDPRWRRPFDAIRARVAELEARAEG